MGRRYKIAPTGSSNAIDFDGARASRERQKALADAKAEQAKKARHAKALQKRLSTARGKRSSGFTYASEEWRLLRYQALKRDGGKCACCGRTRKDGVVMHVDHIKPKSRYPQHAYELSNLQVLCDDCNLGKGAHDETDWR